MLPDRLGLGRGGRVGLLTVTARADQLRLNAEFPKRQPLVGVEGDQRAGRQYQLLATRMLEQVGAQLVDHLVLDTLVAGAVLWREPHRVLIWRVHARDRGGAMLVHLAGELAREFHRAHLRAEQAPESALDEVGDRCLDALQHVHWWTARPSIGSPTDRRSGEHSPGAGSDREAMLRQTGPRRARAATASTPPKTAPRTAPRGLAWAGWDDRPLVRIGVAATRAADQTVAATTSSAALRPRTRTGRSMAPVAHSAAPSRKPRLSSGPITCTAALSSDPSQTARAGVPECGPNHRCLDSS